MKKLKILLIFVILFAFYTNVFSYNISIEPCTAEKISGSVKRETRPFVYEDYVAWKNGDMIIYWKIGMSFKYAITNKSGYFYDLNDYKILYKNNEGKIYLYDVRKKKSSQINLSTPTANYPSYDNNELAYILYSDNNTYFLSDNTTKIINHFENRYDFSAPSLHEGKVAWAEKTDNGYYQIFYWDDDNIVKITNTNYNNVFPSLHNGKIAWQGRKNGINQIFYWDGNTITQITNTDYNNYKPKLYEGKIVWFGKKDGHDQIFYWDGNEIKQLTNNNYDSMYPDIYKDRIVWLSENPIDDYKIYTCTVKVSDNSSSNSSGSYSSMVIYNIHGNESSSSTGTILDNSSIFEKFKMNVPTGQHTYTYSSSEIPVLDIFPGSAKPFAVGNISEGILSLRIGLIAFKNPVDIYLAISYSGLPGDIFLIDSSNGLHKNTIVPWKTNQTDAINESLYGNINTADLPEGTYTLYTLVVPAGATNMNSSYLWVTSFNITH